MRNEPAIDIITAEQIRPGITVAHRRWTTECRPKSNTWPTRRFPACQPEHIHGCDNDGKGACSLGVCHCPCTCGDVWHQYSASMAVVLGAVPCPESACFGGPR